jgi:hypothetical protein
MPVNCATLRTLIALSRRALAELEHSGDPALVDDLPSFREAIQSAESDLARAERAPHRRDQLESALADCYKALALLRRGYDPSELCPAPEVLEARVGGLLGFERRQLAVGD